VHPGYAYAKAGSISSSLYQLDVMNLNIIKFPLSKKERQYSRMFPLLKKIEETLLEYLIGKQQDMRVKSDEHGLN